MVSRKIKDSWHIFEGDRSAFLTHKCRSEHTVQTTAHWKRFICGVCGEIVPEEVVDFAILADLYCLNVSKKIKIVEALNEQ